jgi:hypothetical protein
VSNAAAMMGSAAFLLPLISTAPRNGTPPLMRKLSMSFNAKAQSRKAAGKIKFSQKLCAFASLRLGVEFYCFAIKTRSC